MFEKHNFKLVPGTETIDLGKGLEKREQDLLDRIDAISDKAYEITTGAYNFLRRNHIHEEKIEKAIKEVGFDYILLLLKKVVKNSARATNNSFQDFTLHDDSVAFDNQMNSGGRALTTENKVAINPASISRAANKLELNEEDVKFTAAHVVTHEIIHLLGAKQNENTGFTQGRKNVALNEAMTEFLALTVTRANRDFRNTAEGEQWLLAAYNSEMDCLLALMVLIAKDNQIEIESVIQAFAASYFYDDSITDAFSEFATIGPEAQKLVSLLEGEHLKENSEFDINSLNFDENSRRLLDALRANNNIALKALHL
jgi:hypothetical protein